MKVGAIEILLADAIAVGKPYYRFEARGDGTVRP